MEEIVKEYKFSGDVTADDGEVLEDVELWFRLKHTDEEDLQGKIEHKVSEGFTYLGESREIEEVIESE
tara:strand:- start:159 stop:362 length:204 start_codon:yes stop_codon:yes gene_type:complete